MRYLILALILTAPVHAMDVKSVDEQVREKRITECHEQIDYYKERIRTGAIDWYEEYMLKKWRKRCAEFHIEN